MDRYGIASGKRIQQTTIADKAFTKAHDECAMWLGIALKPANRLNGRTADYALFCAVRRLVRAALDVERQRAFERGMEAFAAMPMVRERHIADSTLSRWTPGVYEGD